MRCGSQQHSFGIVLCGGVYICTGAATIMRRASVPLQDAGLSSASCSGALCQYYYMWLCVATQCLAFKVPSMFDPYSSLIFKQTWNHTMTRNALIKVPNKGAQTQMNCNNNIKWFLRITPMTCKCFKEWLLKDLNEILVLLFIFLENG